MAVPEPPSGLLERGERPVRVATERGHRHQ
ncbi:MAG: hypothetical protein QOI68_1556, partial [Pseudonocardiales bacterium]|nr:hypothetical protein [Pseudonocardiales bacterium]